MSPNSACMRIPASKFARRSARRYGARRSIATSSFVSSTCVPLVSRTVYVPGGTRGPCVALNASCAARGTRGAGTRIVQETRLRPRRLVAEIVSTTFPCASRTSSRMGPKRWRVRWYQVITAPPVGFSPEKLASPSGHPPCAGIRCCGFRPGRKTASRASRSGVRARKGARSSITHRPRPWVAITRSPSRCCSARSRTATAGKPLPLNSAHSFPPSRVIQRPISVPTKRSCGRIVSSFTTWAYPRTPCCGATMRVQVFP